jgi:hypothetical protein
MLGSLHHCSFRSDICHGFNSVVGWQNCPDVGRSEKLTLGAGGGLKIRKKQIVLSPGTFETRFFFISKPL